MHLSKEEEKQLEEFLAMYKKDENVQDMKKYIQHGVVSTYEHCEAVSRVCYWMNRHLNLGADEEALLTGAFLHDFYLYDWHEDPCGEHRLHGFFHAQKACDNAKRVFNISEKEQSIIKSHMWPLNITKIPNSKEAAIVCIADKYCSTIETVLRKRHYKHYKGD